MRTATRGFTLIELMIVLAIVGIVMAIAVPAFNEQIRKSRRSDALRGLADIATAQERWRANHATYAATADLQMPTAQHYTFEVTAGSNTGTAWTATATPAGAQAGDRCGTYTFAVDNVARPGQPPAKTAAETTCF